MARRCSHCNRDSHNSRTCPNRGVRLFGVRLTDGSIQKSASTGNLAVFARSAAAGSPPVNPQDPPVADDGGSGYVSEGFNGGGSASRERKKGVPWTEHEHKMFLLGLKKLGKGDWRGIARNYVISRTPTQVASHAQKYFNRHSATNRRKKRVSLFDIVADETTLADNLSSSSLEQEAQSTSLLPAVPQVSDEQAGMKKDYNTTEMETSLSAPPATMKYSYPPPVYPVFFPLQVSLASDDHADINDNIAAEVEGAIPEPPVTMQYGYPTAYPSFFSPGFHCPIPYWTGNAEPATLFQTHEIVKPMAVYSKSPINVDELFGMSRLSLGACNGEAGPLLPRPELAGSSESQSAFHHAGESSGSPRLDSSSSPIHAI